MTRWTKADRVVLGAIALPILSASVMFLVASSKHMIPAIDFQLEPASVELERWRYHLILGIVHRYTPLLRFSGTLDPGVKDAIGDLHDVVVVSAYYRFSAHLGHHGLQGIVNQTLAEMIDGCGGNHHVVEVLL